MRRILWLILLTLMAAPFAAAQLNPLQSHGTPTGVCSGSQITVDIDTGALWTCKFSSWAKLVTPGPNATGYFGSAATDNGSDYITGLLLNGSTTQTARDVVGLSNTCIAAPDGVMANPFAICYDGFWGFGLGPLNTVSSNTLTAGGMYSDGVRALTTNQVGQTVSVTDEFAYVANPPIFAGPGTMSVTRNQAAWCLNQGNTHIATSSCYRCDAQSGSTANSYCINDTTQTNVDLLARVQSSGLTSIGTAAGIAGTGPCASPGSQTGGAWVGSFTCPGTTGASVITITPGNTVAHGFVCVVTDITAKIIIPQNFFSPTLCQVTAASITLGDTLTFSALGF